MESISTFDIFKIGVGPSSSHTMGPWRTAERFISRCQAANRFDAIIRVQVDLYGSLAKTGKGHGTDVAVLLGLSGVDPVTCDTAQIHPQVETIRASGKLLLGGTRLTSFRADSDLVFHSSISLPYHPNALTFTAFLKDGSSTAETYYSVGGGFVVREGENQTPDNPLATSLPFPIHSAADLLGHCQNHGLTIPEVVRRNEYAMLSPEEIHLGLERIWTTMCQCVFRGAHTSGTLPGGLNVVRRAALLNHTLLGNMAQSTDVGSINSWFAAIRGHDHGFPEVLKWVSCFALAVNEENASFGAWSRHRQMGQRA